MDENPCCSDNRPPDPEIVDLTSEDIAAGRARDDQDVITLDDSRIAPKNEGPITLSSDSETDPESEVDVTCAHISRSSPVIIFANVGPITRRVTNRHAIRSQPIGHHRAHSSRLNNHTTSDIIITNSGTKNYLAYGQRPANIPAGLSTILPRPSAESHSQPPLLQQQPAPAPQPPRPQSPPDSLKCPICIETYVNIKKRGLKIVVTRCGHIFCDFCLSKATKDNGRKCPKCRKAIPRGPAGIIEIFDVC